MVDLFVAPVVLDCSILYQILQISAPFVGAAIVDQGHNKSLQHQRELVAERQWENSLKGQGESEITLHSNHEELPINRNVLS